MVLFSIYTVYIRTALGGSLLFGRSQIKLPAGSALSPIPITVIMTWAQGNQVSADTCMVKDVSTLLASQGLSFCITFGL